MTQSEIKIQVLSRLEAAEILCSPDRCAEITYLVSIGDGDDPLPEGYENAARRLRWLIADVVTEEGATEDDIKRIINLAEQLHSKRHPADPLRGGHQSFNRHSSDHVRLLVGPRP